MDIKLNMFRSTSKFFNIGNNGNVISLFLLILVSQVNLIKSYSNVRRSGSVVAIEAVTHTNLTSFKDSPNVSPMLKPADFKYEIINTGPSESFLKAKKNLSNTLDNLQHNEEMRHSTESISKSKLSEENTVEHRLINFTASDGILFDKNGEKIHDDQEESFVDQMAEAFDLVEGDILPNAHKNEKVKELEKEILKYVDSTFSKDSYDLLQGIKIEPVSSLLGRNSTSIRGGSPRLLRSLKDISENEIEEFDTRIIRKFDTYAKDHVLSVNLPQAARFFGFKSNYSPRNSKYRTLKEKSSHYHLSSSRTFSFVTQGKSSFLTGFGLGFLAFGIKKLLLPLFIGAQIVKSVLIAMFLPSILGSLGKIVGKGLSQFSGSSANFGQPQVQNEELDFKDSTGYATDQGASYTYPPGDGIGTLPADSLYGNQNDLANVAMSRYGPGGAKVTYIPSISDNYYRHANRKQEDYKVFHNIPASSLLLSNYDPFYSPLLSRLDSVFQRLGLGALSAEGNGKNLPQERCRERLVCMMYASPAKYAPYSNLVSAQLSRELNELRKPTSDNPEILRFFRYMRAAKDGQEGIDCTRLYPSCPSLTAESGSVAMITTYNDINKLVSARKI